MERTREYRRISILVGTLSVLCLFCNATFAEPYLQLDAYPAVYVGGGEESIVSTQLDFTLYALVNSESKKFDGLGTHFYISATLEPQVPVVPPDTNFGSIFLDGVEIIAVSDMLYGTPPGMPPHGAFPTYYYEHEFTLDPDKRTTLYDSQDVDLNGPLQIDPDGELYFENFEINATGLPHGLLVHFDLYTKDSGGLLDEKAPFSHDVLAAPVPGAILLGVLGLTFAGIKLRKFA